MKYRLVLEVSDKVTVEQLHEWLCRSIHENDTEAQDQLTEVVADVGFPEALS